MVSLSITKALWLLLINANGCLLICHFPCLLQILFPAYDCSYCSVAMYLPLSEPNISSRELWKLSNKKKSINIGTQRSLLYHWKRLHHFQTTQAWYTDREHSNVVMFWSTITCQVWEYHKLHLGPEHLKLSYYPSPNHIQYVWILHEKNRMHFKN